MNDRSLPVSRRAFLGRGAAGAAAVGAGALQQARARAAAAAGSRAPVDPDNPWRYDVDRLRQVDPALIHYEAFARFAAGTDTPRRLAIGPSGRIYLAAGKGVRVLSPEGTLLSTIAVSEPVRCVRPLEDGRVLVGLRNRIEVYEAGGRRLVRGPALGGKPFLTGLAVSASGEEWFVADSGNRVVYRCDPTGQVQLRIGERNGDRGVPGLVLPSPFLDVEVGADGLLRINNPGRHLVEVYTRDGDREAGWGRAGAAIDAFCGCCNPINLALLPDGRCVTAEKGLPRVKVFSPEGRLESVVAAPDAFAPVASEDRGAGAEDTVGDGLDVAVDGEGRVWVLDLVGAEVHGFRRKAGAAPEAAERKAAG